MRINLDDYVGKIVSATVTTKSGGKYSGTIHHDNILIGSTSGTTDSKLQENLPPKGVMVERLPFSKDGNKHYVTFDNGAQMEVIGVS